jgi:hypothetical protein
MSRSIRSESTDDPEFVALVERITARSFKQGHYDEVFIIEIKNWFDHKWLKFSGIGRVPFDSPRNDHPQVALDEFWQEKITFPPFTPNRILRQQWHPAKKLKRGTPVHVTERREHSSWNLQMRVTQFARSALFVWFSSGTKRNDRGSMMLYQVHDGSVSAWYASFRKAASWVLHLTKGITRESLERLMSSNAEPSAPANVRSAPGG